MFDTALVASNRRREVRRRLATLPAVVAVHAMAVGFVMVGQLWAVDQVQEVVPLTPIFVHVLPPPGGGDGDRGGKHAKLADRPHVAPPLVQPPEIPSEIPKNTGPEPSTGETVPGSGQLGPGTGEVAGPPGGVDGPAVNPAREDPQPVGPIHITAEVVAPVGIDRPAPRYPEVARRLGVHGDAVLEAVIDEEGRVTRVRLVRDPGFGCGEAALDAVRGWRYEPARLNGRRVAVYLTIKITFRLNGVG